jgi:hypothetical protein
MLIVKPASYRRPYSGSIILHVLVEHGCFLPINFSSPRFLSSVRNTDKAYHVYWLYHDNA